MSFRGNLIMKEGMTYHYQILCWNFGVYSETNGNKCKFGFLVQKEVIKLDDFNNDKAQLFIHRLDHGVVGTQQL